MIFWKFNGNQLHIYGAVNEYCKVPYGNHIWIEMYDHGQDKKVTSLLQGLFQNEVLFCNRCQTPNTYK